MLINTTTIKKQCSSMFSKEYFQENIYFIDHQLDPIRTIFNQVCRIFSGCITDILFGHYWSHHVILPTVLSLGLASNSLNAFYKYSLFYNTKGWREYWPYLSLTCVVGVISNISLARYILSHGNLTTLQLHGLPLSLVCGSLQLSAECWNLFDRYKELKKAEASIINKANQQSSKSIDIDDELVTDLINKLSAYRTKCIIVITLLSILIIGWSSNIFKSVYISLGSVFSILITTFGLTVSAINYFKKRLCKNYLYPSHAQILTMIHQSITK